MADPIWRMKIWKNLKNWRISMRVGTKGFFGSLKTYLMSIFNLKFIFSDPNNPLVPIFIQIRQLIGFFRIYGRHIVSAISKFRILTCSILILQNLKAIFHVKKFNEFEIFLWKKRRFRIPAQSKAFFFHRKISNSLNYLILL